MSPKTIIIAVVLVLGGILAYVLFGMGFSRVHDGRIVVSKYFCSDVCPANGAYYDVYYGINTKVQCEAIGGAPIEDPAWGGFIGCGPQ